MTYDFDTVVDRRGTWCVQWDGITDRFPVPDLLPFTISDMDFRSPPEVLDALTARIGHGVFGYSDWHNEEFRGAIRDWYRDRYATEVDVDQLVYAPSVLNQIAQLLRMWTVPGDAVVAHTPTYDGFRKCVTGLGRELRTVGVDDWDALERELARPDARALFLCSPHNPTGHVWTDAELRRIAGLARTHDIAVISDEIHSDLTHDGHVHRPFTAYGDGLRWALVTSGSKSFNFPALTGSYGFVGDPADHAEFVRRMGHDEGLESPAVLALTAHIAAYREGGAWLDQLRAYTYGNLRLLEDRLKEAFPELGWRVPEAGYLAWIDLRPLGITADEELQRVLVERERVAIMPGGTYGDPGFVRLNLGCPRSKAEAGIEALVRAVATVRPDDADWNP
ncbi:aminotransferase class I/II-fold pyridoxal phosphate-dependent enzyme [Streptomyces sp. HUAS MG91]|uniref:cysteine-S-conjugate beta-lyase n=1 Tax=Streptomyces tabacisoli TaxID=3156398 RepID=A0AAU8IU65_9ACTN